MSNKVPCGGFYLSDTLGVDENGKLGVSGGEPYKSLVTDGEGGVKWEDRLAYDDSELVINGLGSGKYVKVADEVPSWASVDSPIKYWMSNGTNDTVPTENYFDLGSGSFAVELIAFIIATDNIEFRDIVFPKKGVYFLSASDTLYVTGIASADSGTPEITWDGNTGLIKKLDVKFIPDIPAEKLPDIPAEKLPDIPAEKLPDIPAHVIEVNGRFTDSIENTPQPSYTVKNLNYSEILSIFNSKNFVIKDNDTYYRPINVTIQTEGDLLISILVSRINTSGSIVLANLACTNNTNRFFRNGYCTIAVQQP